jgi:hypothetical protein
LIPWLIGEQELAGLVCARQITRGLLLLLLLARLVLSLEWASLLLGRVGRTLALGLWRIRRGNVDIPLRLSLLLGVTIRIPRKLRGVSSWVRIIGAEGQLSSETGATGTIVAVTGSTILSLLLTLVTRGLGLCLTWSGASRHFRPLAVALIEICHKLGDRGCRCRLTNITLEGRLQTGPDHTEKGRGASDVGCLSVA